MSQENYEHVYYKNYPHFTVGHVDQWGERGFLLYQDKVLQYEEDRKGQWGRNYNPRSIPEFMTYTREQGIKIPKDFIKAIDKGGPI